MSWPAALLVGVLSAINGTAITAAVADYAMEAHNVSNVEGARGFGVVFVFMPLGFLTGLTGLDNRRVAIGVAFFVLLDLFGLLLKRQRTTPRIPAGNPTAAPQSDSRRSARVATR